MRQIQWKVVINDDDNQIAIAEKAEGFSSKSIADNLTIIGMLENIKAKHQEIIKSLYSNTKNL